MTAPASEVKTNKDYFWLLPHAFNAICKMIINLKGTGFKCKDDLKKAMRGYFTKSVLSKADVPVHSKPGHTYSLRTLRAYRATEWMQLVTEYKIMGWEPLPPNPLQHETDATTKRHYAAKGCDSEWEARKRICEKYYDNPTLRTPWMEAWKNAN